MLMYLRQYVSSALPAEYFNTVEDTYDIVQAICSTGRLNTYVLVEPASGESIEAFARRYRNIPMAKSPWESEATFYRRQLERSESRFVTKVRADQEQWEAARRARRLEAERQADIEWARERVPRKQNVDWPRVRAPRKQNVDWARYGEVTVNYWRDYGFGAAQEDYQLVQFLKPVFLTTDSKPPRFVQQALPTGLMFAPLNAMMFVPIELAGQLVSNGFGALIK